MTGMSWLKFSWWGVVWGVIRTHASAEWGRDMLRDMWENDYCLEVWKFSLAD